MPDILQTALRCAERGWLIFPCHNATKRPLTEHGLHDATRDPATIAAWFEKWPGAMVGVKCGRESGLLVVDCDVDATKNIDAVATFAEMFPSLPETTTVRTPRTGRHYYFSYPCAGADIRNSAGKIAPGIDIRAEGGYVVAAGSQRSDGVFYEVLVDTDPAPAPQALIERLAAEKPKAEAPPPPSAKAEAPPPASRDDAECAMLARAVARGRRGERRSGNGHDNAYGRAALEAECAKVASAAKGGRNHQLNASAFSLGQLIAGGVLYCALEDNLRRIKSRMIKMFGPDVEGSPRLQVLCEMEKLAEGGIDRLKRWIASAANPRMIIIDTLSMVRVSKSRDDTAFQADYDAVKDLRALANEYGIAIILVHHLRKADSEDPFDTVNATLGLTAAVDSVLIIKRDTLHPARPRARPGRDREGARLQQGQLHMDASRRRLRDEGVGRPQRHHRRTCGGTDRNEPSGHRGGDGDKRNKVARAPPPDGQQKRD